MLLNVNMVQARTGPNFFAKQELFDQKRAQCSTCTREALMKEVNEAFPGDTYT